MSGAVLHYTSGETAELRLRHGTNVRAILADLYERFQEGEGSTDVEL